MNKFEKDLKAFFPELYDVLKLRDIDPKAGLVDDAMLKFRECDEYGEIRITYQRGKINHIDKMVRD